MKQLKFLLLICPLYILSVQVNAADGAPVFEAVSVIAEQNLKDHTYLLPLGRIKKDRSTGRDLPAKFKRVQGSFSSTVWELNGEDTQLEAKAKINGMLDSPAYESLFQCEGRDCGESFAWANAMFKQPILYGSDRNQSLWVVEHKPSDSYRLYYLIERPNRRIYFYQETLSYSNNLDDTVALQSRLESHGSVIIANLMFQNLQAEIPKLVSKLEQIQLDMGEKLFLVIHRHGEKGMAADAAEFKAQLEQAISQQQIGGFDVFDVSNLAPNTRANSCCWLELVNPNWQP